MKMETSSEESSSPSGHSRSNVHIHDIFSVRHYHHLDLYDLINTSNAKSILESLSKEEVQDIWRNGIDDAFDQWLFDDIERLINLLLDVPNTRNGLSDPHIENYIAETSGREYSSDLLQRMVETRIASSSANNNPSENKFYVDEEGSTLLHIATYCYRKSSRNFHLLHHYNPNFVCHRNNDLELPLHTIFSDIFDFNEDDYDGVRTLLELNPNAVKIKNKDGKLPFHLLCQNFREALIPYEQLFELIYNANPFAVKTRLPSEHFKFEYLLHFLCRDTDYREPSIISFVLEKYPECIIRPTGIGLTPFHMVSERVAADDGIKNFLEQVRQSEELKQRMFDMRFDNSNNNLLHVISKRTFTDEAAPFFQLSTTSTIFCELVKLFPNLVVQENDQGDLPIQVLLQNNGNRHDFKEVEAIAKAYDAYCIEHRRMNHLDCPSSNLNDGTTNDKEYPLIVAASQNDPCISTIFYFAKRYAKERGGFLP